MAQTKVRNHIPDAVVTTDWRNAFFNFAYAGKQMPTGSKAREWYYNKASALFNGRP